MKKYMLIINPISGSGHSADVEGRVRKLFDSDGFHLEVRQSQKKGDCGRLAREAVRRGFYAVLAAGGDGTVNEVASHLHGSKTILGIIPTGSGNGLARHLYESVDIDYALKVISSDNPKACDYGTANGRDFFCTFGIGFDAAVSQMFAQMRHRGLSSYIRSALQQYFTYQPRTYEIDTGSGKVTIKAFIIAVCNASQYGNNAYIAPSASISDGLLDIVIIHAGNPLSLAFMGVELFTGHIDKNLLIQTIKVKKATIKELPGPAHVDGEPVMMPETIKVKCHPGKIRIFTAPDRHRFLPWITPLRSFHFDLNYHFKSLFRRLNKINHR